VAVLNHEPTKVPAVTEYEKPCSGTQAGHAEQPETTSFIS